MDKIFGDDAPETERRPTLVVPGRCVNSVEIELREAAMLSRNEPPMIWLVEDEIEDTLNDWEKWFGARLTLAEVMELSDIFSRQGIEEFRRQIVTARELGATATFDLYRVACEMQGIPPLI